MSSNIPVPPGNLLPNSRMYRFLSSLKTSIRNNAEYRHELGTHLPIDRIMLELGSKILDHQGSEKLEVP